MGHHCPMKTVSEPINKYNRPGPRYTSYPPLPFWSNPPDQETWIAHVKHLYESEKGIDLYVHIPYCESLCYYCGCSRTITKDHSVEEHFISLVLNEWKLYEKKFGFIPLVHSLHFGGGTPTFLSPANLNKLMKALLINKTPHFIGSIEIDPRTCSSEHLDVFVENEIRRISLGIQDFDPEVQKLINRYQSKEMVQELVDKIRNRGISSINFDLIYGLPGQTHETIDNTMQIVSELKPDIIAFYSYAHLPEKIKNQRLIKDDLLLGPELKNQLHQRGRSLLLEYGYTEIGIDHFALPTSYLYKAQAMNQLHRNFMGHVDKKSNILIGLGPSSISDSSMSFIQNSKEMKDYESKILGDELPIEKGHTHTDVDLYIQDIIMKIMCQKTIILGKGILPYAEEVMQDLNEFQKDGIVEINNNELKITNEGKIFTRNIAMAFDFYLRQKTNTTRFSQII
jgi:oxygen-independent coproporphyrinogen-3 oxidase